MNNKQGPGRFARLVPVLCNLTGTLILAAILLTCVPLTVPRLMGYEAFHVVSGSMEPEIPVGSIVYVEAVEPLDVQAGDVIAFYRGNSVVVHRVLSSDPSQEEFVTKGDANEEEDLDTVSYHSLIGHVAYHYPVLGRLMFFYTSSIGKICVICFAAFGVMLNLLAGQIRKARCADTENT